jgi:hypothetical protein
VIASVPDQCLGMTFWDVVRSLCLIYLVVAGRGLSQRLAEREANKGCPGCTHSYR